MSVEFVEGRCCGDCAKCELQIRPRTAVGMQACATANMLPKLFCLHDMVVEQNSMLSKLLKQKDKDLNEYKLLVAKLLSHANSEVPASLPDINPEEELEGVQDVEQAEADNSEEIKPKKIKK